MKLLIRFFTLVDIPGAMRLKELARWNQTEADWRRLLKLEPQGCFAISVGDRLVGTATTTRYGTELAWIGMVLVDPEFRRRGIATSLMGAALDYLRSAGVETVKLDATPDGRHVYEGLGFETESLVERWEGFSATDSAGRDEASPDVKSFASIAQIATLDRHAFGADRSELLGMLIRDAGIAPLVHFSPQGDPSGYVLAREGTNAAYVGPLVANDSCAAARLLDCMLERLRGQRVYVDLNTDFTDGSAVLSARGFTMQRKLIRMRKGKKRGSGPSSAVFAIAAPEVG